MKNLILLKLALISSLLAIGCGRPLQPLTDAQKEVLKDTSANAGRVGSISTSAGNSGSSGSLTSRLAEGSNDTAQVSVAQFVTLSPSSASNANAASNSDVRRKAMSEKLKKAFDDKSCAVHSQITGLQASYSVDGGSCPIQAKMKMDINGKRDGNDVSGSGTFNVEYSTTDVDFRTHGDFHSFKLNMNLNGSATNNGKNFNVNSDYYGEFYSQKYGNVKIKGHIKLDGKDHDKNGEVLLRLEYPSFDAEFKAIYSGSSVKYTLNGEPVTESQVREYFASQGVSGSSTTTVTEFEDKSTTSTTTSVNYNYSSSGYYSYVPDQYQFAGVYADKSICNTGNQNFSNSDMKDRAKAYCEALQDDTLNKGCAESSRRIYFNFYCQGQTWTPKNPYKYVAPVTTTPTTTTTTTTVKAVVPAQKSVVASKSSVKP